MRLPYVIDACALIDASKNYKMSKTGFAFLWDAFEELFESNSLISSIEVLEELKDEDLLIWAKQHKKYFHPLSREIQEKTSEILSEYPNLISIRSTGNSNADPFLIATAIIKGGTIVTNERLQNGNGNKIGIPNVCEALGVPYTDLLNLINEIVE